MAFSMSQNDINNYINQRKQEDYIKQEKEKEKQKEQEIYQDFLKAYNQFTNMIWYQLENNENNWQERLSEFYKKELYVKSTYNLYKDGLPLLIGVQPYLSSGFKEGLPYRYCMSFRKNEYHWDNKIIEINSYENFPDNGRKIFEQYMSESIYNLIMKSTYDCLFTLLKQNNMKLSPFVRDEHGIEIHFTLYFNT